MRENTLGGAVAVEAEAPRRRFGLVRFFMLATLGFFVAAGVALFTLQRMEETFFDEVQRERQAFFAAAQAELAREDEIAARASLLAVHEAAHVTLTGVVANLMWHSEIAPVVARAAALPIEPCRALPAAGAAPARRACWAELGRRIRALPGFAALDARAHTALSASRVFKVKVWDVRGVAVYSSELAQVGEDGSDNQGWRTAISGRPASELTHRDRFSAFEGVVENRDLISTYVPVRNAAGTAVVGVFELYSDVTPFLEQINAASRRFEELARANDAKVREDSARSQQSVLDSSTRFLFTVGGLMLLLYLASLGVVWIGQRIIDRQARAQQQAALREQQRHAEKMAALAAMAAHVAHEVGNPLAVISGLVQELAAELRGSGAAGEPPAAKRIFEQTTRIAQLTRQISDLATAGGSARRWVDVNPMLNAVCDLQRFDRRFLGVPLDFLPGQDLPACELAPDHLNEVLMQLLQVYAERALASRAPRRLVVRSEARGGDVVVHIRCSGHGNVEGDATQGARPSDADTRIGAAIHRAQDMGAGLALEDEGATLTLRGAGRDAG